MSHLSLCSCQQKSSDLRPGVPRRAELAAPSCVFLARLGRWRGAGGGSFQPNTADEHTLLGSMVPTQGSRRSVVRKSTNSVVASRCEALNGGCTGRNPKMETSTGSLQLNLEQPLVNSSSSKRLGHSGASRCQVFKSELPLVLRLSPRRPSAGHWISGFHSDAPGYGSTEEKRRYDALTFSEGVSDEACLQK